MSNTCQSYSNPVTVNSSQNILLQAVTLHFLLKLQHQYVYVVSGPCFKSHSDQSPTMMPIIFSPGVWSVDAAVGAVGGCEGGGGEGGGREVHPLPPRRHAAQAGTTVLAQYISGEMW